MPYYLHLFFDPDHDSSRLKPAEREDGSVDHYELGYVQNVIMNQVIAELREISEKEAAGLDSRFVLAESTIPGGSNTAVNPHNPLQLIAKTNGYACFENGRVAVKNVLVVTTDVSFHTGNILFVGDLVVEKNVLGGFKIQARNILVKGHIGGAEVTAQESIAAESGVKGERQALISAGKNLRIPFCEHAKLLAKENILIGGVCLHSELYVGKQLAVKGKLIGGSVYCRSIAYVQEQLGGSGNSTTLTLGYDPFLLRKSELLDDQIEELEDELDTMKSRIEKFNSLETEIRPKILAAEKKRLALLSQKLRIWDLIKERESLRNCGLVVPGTVMPGVTISIGEASRTVNEPLENVRFTLRGDKIHISSPAMHTR